jgi:hypothetical protein
VDLGIPDLTSEQIERLCLIAEEAARKHVLSKISKTSIEKLDVCTEVEGTKPVRLEINVDVDLSPTLGDFNVQKLANEAVNAGFKSAEKYLRELACHSQK